MKLTVSLCSVEKAEFAEQVVSYSFCHWLLKCLMTSDLTSLRHSPHIRTMGILLLICFLKFLDENTV